MKNNSSQTEIKRYPKRIITSFQLGNLVGLMMSQMMRNKIPFYSFRSDTVVFYSNIYLCGTFC